MFSVTDHRGVMLTGLSGFIGLSLPPLPIPMQLGWGGKREVDDKVVIRQPVPATPWGVWGKPKIGACPKPSRTDRFPGSVGTGSPGYSAEDIFSHDLDS